MTFRLYGAQPSSEPIQAFCQIDHEEHKINETLFKIQKFPLKQMYWSRLILLGPQSVDYPDLLKYNNYINCQPSHFFLHN